MTTIQLQIEELQKKAERYEYWSNNMLKLLEIVANFKQEVDKLIGIPNISIRNAKAKQRLDYNIIIAELNRYLTENNSLSTTKIAIWLEKLYDIKSPYQVLNKLRKMKIIEHTTEKPYKWFLVNKHG